MSTVVSAAGTAAFLPPRPPAPTALRYDTEYPVISYADRPTRAVKQAVVGDPTQPAG